MTTGGSGGGLARWVTALVAAASFAAVPAARAEKPTRGQGGYACQARPVGGVVAFGCKGAPGGGRLFVLDQDLTRVRLSGHGEPGLGEFVGFGRTHAAWGAAKVPALEVRFLAPGAGKERAGSARRPVLRLLVAGAMVTLVDPARGEAASASPCLTLVEMMCAAAGERLCGEIRREVDGKVSTEAEERQCAELLGDPARLRELVDAARAAGERAPGPAPRPAPGPAIDPPRVSE